MTEEMATAVSSLGLRFLDRSLRDLDEIKQRSTLAGGAGTVIDRDEAWRLVHRMAGTAGTFGFGEIGREAQGIEASLRDMGDPRAATTLAALARLRRLVSAARHDA